MGSDEWENSEFIKKEKAENKRKLKRNLAKVEKLREAFNGQLRIYGVPELHLNHVVESLIKDAVNILDWKGE